MTLVIMAILGLVLASYLLLLRAQNLSVARAQSWNTGIAVAEAGVEEALAHINKTAVYFTLPNIASDGWTPVGNYVVAPRRYIGSNFYDVIIQTGTNPVIYATGYTTVPISQQLISRTLRVDTIPEPLFTGPMVALTNIDTSGGGIETDSYDSSDPNYSTNGNYDPAKARDNGHLITNSKSTDKNRPALALGNAKIRGRVRTGPGGLITLNSSSVGDGAWVLGGSLGIKPGWSDDDVSLSLPDVAPPYQTGVLPIAEKNNSLPDYVLGTGDYYMSTLKVSGTSKTNIVVTGKTRLYVTGDFIVNGDIAIQPGASLQLFVGGTSAATPTKTALGSVYAPNAASFQYYGLPNNTDVTYNGGNDFKAIMYAPEATLKVGGGGSTTSGTNLYDFQGVYMVNSLTMNGHFKFHYDEQIPKTLKVWRGFIANRWQEL